MPTRRMTPKQPWDKGKIIKTRLEPLPWGTTTLPARKRRQRLA